MNISKVIFHIKPIPSHPWWECKNNNKQDLYRPLVLKFGYFLVYLVLLSPYLYFHTCNYFISFFTTMFIRHTGNYQVFLLCIFYRNKFSLMRTPTWVETFENMKPWVNIFSGPQGQLSTPKNIQIQKNILE